MAAGARAGRVSALIIAGGRGTRFWPASREANPKPLFSLDGKRTLLADTIARLRPLVSRDRIFVVAAASHEKPFRRALAGLIPARNLIVEPAARGTAVAIAYGAAVIRRRLGDGIIAVMWADHAIEPAAGFRKTLADAIALAASHPSIVVIGVKPTRADPGLGYQKIGAAVGRGYRVARFIEKPAPAVAQRMVKSGKYLWNAGIFVMSSATLDAELRRHTPALASAAERMAAMAPARIARSYKRLSYDSIDREIVEKSRNVLGVRAAFNWHDVGSWEGLWEAVRGRGENVIRGNVLALDSNRILAHSDSRLMVLFGVRDLIAVDTGDAILIAHRSQSPEIRRVTEELARRGMHRYL
ncbi:MAG TPA: sugar phosphate nucleotidyltransferase [Candidatus Binataceae bacterium]|nr:sugar phosphate nucleotidyltransferase [Candidatus Binataceae bacterium]